MDSYTGDSTTTLPRTADRRAQSGRPAGCLGRRNLTRMIGWSVLAGAVAGVLMTMVIVVSSWGSTGVFSTGDTLIIGLIVFVPCFSVVALLGSGSAALVARASVNSHRFTNAQWGWLAGIAAASPAVVAAVCIVLSEMPILGVFLPFCAVWVIASLAVFGRYVYLWRCEGNFGTQQSASAHFISASSGFAAAATAEQLSKSARRTDPLLPARGHGRRLHLRTMIAVTSAAGALAGFLVIPMSIYLGMRGDPYAPSFWSLFDLGSVFSALLYGGLALVASVVVAFSALAGLRLRRLSAAGVAALAVAPIVVPLLAVVVYWVVTGANPWVDESGFFAFGGFNACCFLLLAVLDGLYVYFWGRQLAQASHGRQARTDLHLPVASAGNGTSS